MLGYQSMNQAKKLTFSLLVAGLTIGSLSARAESTVRDWTHEADELTTGSSAATNDTDQGELFDLNEAANPWDAFVAQLPNSKFIKWGLSWAGITPYEKNSLIADSTTTMSPASVQKILTSTTALRVLGPDFRFANSFQAKLDADAKTVSGVEFSVSGDPTWGHSAYGEKLLDRMQKVVAELTKNGVKKVTGEIKVTLTQPRLAEHERPEQWKQSWLLECYATLPTAVTLNGNCATLKVSAANKAAWVTAGVSTPLDVKLTKAKHTAVEVAPILDDFGRVAKYEIRGTFGAAASYTVPVQNNVDWLKNLFALALQQAGIVYEKTPAAQPVIHERFWSPKRAYQKTLTDLYVDLSSKTLREILPAFLENSINLIGDRLYLEVAYHLGSVKMDEPELRSLVEIIGDVNAPNNVVVLDGSGLIAADQIAAQTLRLYLKGLLGQTYFNDFLRALPVAGKTGTMASRLGGTLTKGKVFAKTGTIDGVANLAGYFLKPDSTYEPIVVFTRSNLAASTVRTQMDKIVSEFARQNASLSRIRKP
jgi:D-alanyl-D-alanine carboxypeptidase/D-alanyl-D-alanine-endopeptidase (penicillin-binding protein 4)